MVAALAGNKRVGLRTNRYRDLVAWGLNVRIIINIKTTTKTERTT